jgi:adenosine deaminase
VVGFRDPAHAATAGLPVYPLRTLWDAGLPLTLCTDNPGISRTTLADEYLTAARMVDGLSLWDALAMMRQGFVHAFLPGAEREILLKQADSRIYRTVLDRFQD